MIARIYTIQNIRTGTYWQSIDDVNSTEDWGTAFTFWLDMSQAEKCLSYHKQDDEYHQYDFCKVVELNIESLFYR